MGGRCHSFKMKITILDQVNIHIEGLSRRDLNHIRQGTRISDKSAFMTAAYKLGEYDGYHYMVDEDGFTYFYLLDEILQLLEEIGITESDIEFVDEVKPVYIPDSFDFDSSVVRHATGYDLRDDQMIAISKALEAKNGILNLATNFGKTAVSLAISTLLDPYCKTIFTAPSEQLCNQTFETYSGSGLNVGLLKSSVAVKKREAFIENHNHLITTPQLLFNTVDLIKDSSKYAIIVDEVHRNFGDVFFNCLKYDFADAPIRIGLTGTLPKDKYKKTRIYCALGGGVIERVASHVLISQGISSDLDIKMVVTEDQAMKEWELSPAFDWSMESEYLNKNKKRGEAIRDFIDSLPKVNTLVLCSAEAQHVITKPDEVYIDKDVKVEDRAREFKKFGERDDFTLFASYQTVSTGLSENDIFRLIMIDGRKDVNTVIQSIGRAIRLDGEVNKIEVYDISADLKYSNRHRKVRIKEYKAEKYPYADYGKIQVEQE